MILLLFCLLIFCVLIYAFLKQSARYSEIEEVTCKNCGCKQIGTYGKWAGCKCTNCGKELV